MRRLLIFIAVLGLTACASVTRLGAANDVHALLLSIRDNDQAAFDAHVDRPALKQQIEALIVQRTDKRYGGLASLLAPGIAEFAGDTLVQPSVFRQVARQYGYGDDTRIPGAIAIASALKPLPDGRVCAVKKKGGPCTLVFTKEQGVWKLTGFQGDLKDLRLKL
ncbi:MAG TPA: DUF2939 domain-containing protein [Phenylobacterium sp.]|jgi:hypothetical protein|nr:DUF2939 domain-containing protein [Phenylobacterium sp.]